MSYERVIPRDLFNEAKLLKCLGFISLAILDRTINLKDLTHGLEHGFTIYQLESDGSIYCANVRFYTKRGTSIFFYSPLNSKLNFPLEFEFAEVSGKVFNEDGKFTEEFLDTINKET